MEIGYKGSQGSVLGLQLINTFFIATDSGGQCCLGRFVDDSKQRVLRICLGKGKDLDRLEGWPCVNLMEFNKAKGHLFNSLQYI